MTGGAAGGRRRRCHGSSALGVVAGGLLLTGCGPVNAGAEAAQEYRSWVEDVDGVGSVDITGNNSLPFMSEVTGYVTLEEPSSAAEVAATLEELSTFEFESPGRMSLNVGVIYVTGDSAITMSGPGDADPEEWAALVTDPAVSDTVTSASFRLFGDDRVSLDAVTRGDAVAGADVLDGVLDRHLGVTVGSYSIMDATSTSGLHGNRTEPAREVYAHLVAQHPIASVRVREGEVRVTLPDLDPTARAELVAQVTAMSTPEVVVEVEDAPTS